MGRYLDLSGYFDLIDRIKRATSGDAWLFALSQKEVQDEIIHLNTEVQLYEEGIRADGSFIGHYTDFTISRKILMGERYDHITLYMFGDFYGSFFVEYDEDSFTIKADGQKGDKNLFKIYGDNVLGLTEFSIDKVKQTILKYYAEYISKLYHNGGRIDL